MLVAASRSNAPAALAELSTLIHTNASLPSALESACPVCDATDDKPGGDYAKTKEPRVSGALPFATTCALQVFGVDALGLVLRARCGSRDGHFGVVFAFVVDRVLLHALALVGSEDLR
jgi:hypothetical protein